MEYRNTGDSGILLPKSGSISLSDDLSAITISVPSEFEIYIKTSFKSTGDGLPMDYPQVKDYPIKDCDPNEEIHEEYDSSAASLRVKYTSKYPEQSYEDYRASRIYYDELIDTFSYSHDWEEFIEELPHKRIFDIQNRVENIESKIDGLIQE